MISHCSVGQQCVLEIVLLGNHVQVNSEHKMTTAVNEEMVNLVILKTQN